MWQFGGCDSGSKSVSDLPSLVFIWSTISIVCMVWQIADVLRVYLPSNINPTGSTVGCQLWISLDHTFWKNPLDVTREKNKQLFVLFVIGKKQQYVAS